MKRLMLIFAFMGSFIYLNAQGVEYVSDSNKQRIIKADFLAPMTGNITLGYEHLVKPGFSLHGQIGLPGVGITLGRNGVKGVFGKAGVRFYPGKDFSVQTMRLVHPLRGFYVEPQVIGSSYTLSETFWDSYSGETNTVYEVEIAFSAMLNAGYQLIMSDIFSLEAHVGMGYGVSREGYMYHYSHVDFTNDFPLALSSGFKIGVLF